MQGARPLTQDEVQKVLTYLEGPNYLRERALFLLGIKTGLRLKFILKLKVNDVATHGIVRTHIHIKGSAGRYGEDFDQPLQLEERVAVQKYIETLRPDEMYLFHGRFPKTAISRSQAWRIMLTVFKGAGVFGGPGDISCHTLRKTFALKFFRESGNSVEATVAALRLTPGRDSNSLPFLAVQKKRKVIKDRRTEPQKVTTSRAKSRRYQAPPFDSSFEVGSGQVAGDGIATETGAGCS